MTLIVSILTDELTAQASDRRLTAVRSGKAIQIAKDNAIKTVYVRCRDAHFSISWTGIGMVVDATTKKATGTSEWITAALVKMDAIYLSLEAIVRYFTDHAALQFQQFSIPTTFVFCGFQHHYEDGGPHSKVFGFEVSSGPFTRLEVLRRKNSVIFIHGATDAVTALIQRDLRRYFKRGRFRQEYSKNISTILVNSIRAAASTKVGTTVGRDCLTAVIRRDHPDRIVCESHQEHKTAINETPLIIALPKISFGGFAVGNSDGMVPVIPTGDIIFGNSHINSK